MLVKQAVKIIYNKSGKPIRVTPTAIRREVGCNRRIFDGNLILTNNHIKEVSEEIDEFRIRKIKWAIKELG